MYKTHLFLSKMQVNVDALIKTKEERDLMLSSKGITKGFETINSRCKVHEELHKRNRCLNFVFRQEVLDKTKGLIAVMNLDGGILTVHAHISNISLRALVEKRHPVVTRIEEPIKVHDTCDLCSCITFKIDLLFFIEWLSSGDWKFFTDTLNEAQYAVIMSKSKAQSTNVTIFDAKKFSELKIIFISDK